MAIKKDKITIVPPHKNISRPANDNDAKLIVELSERMDKLMDDLIIAGVFSEIFALHHSQIVSRPINFFVIYKNNQRLNEKYPDFPRVIVNPKIIDHTNQLLIKGEGCLSFPGKPHAEVNRWNKILCEYQIPVLQDDGSYTLSDIHCENITGVLSQMFQHEIDHANGIYIYKLK